MEVVVHRGGGAWESKKGLTYSKYWFLILSVSTQCIFIIQSTKYILPFPLFLYINYPNSRHFRRERGRGGYTYISEKGVLKSIFYKNILENPSHTKNLQGLSYNQQGSSRNFLYEMDFQICSYKKWTLINTIILIFFKNIKISMLSK